MRLQVEVHAPANGCMVTGIVCDVDTGQHVLFVRERNGRWTPLAASARNSEVHKHDGEAYLLPIEIEGDLNRAHNLAAQRAKVARSYSTVSAPASSVDTHS